MWKELKLWVCLYFAGADLSEHEEALSPASAHSEDKVDDGDLSDRSV